MCKVVRGHLLFVYSVEEATVGTYHCVMVTKDNRLVTGDAKLGFLCYLLIVPLRGRVYRPRQQCLPVSQEQQYVERPKLTRIWPESHGN